MTSYSVNTSKHTENGVTFGVQVLRGKDWVQVYLDVLKVDNKPIYTDTIDTGVVDVD